MSDMQLITDRYHAQLERQSAEIDRLQFKLEEANDLLEAAGDHERALIDEMAALRREADHLRATGSQMENSRQSKKQITYLAAADGHIIRMLTAELIATFEAYINEYPGKVDYIDGLMAAHNFYKAIVGHLAEETGDSIWWNVALATTAEAFQKELAQ